MFSIYGLSWRPEFKTCYHYFLLQSGLGTLSKTARCAGNPTKKAQGSLCSTSCLNRHRQKGGERKHLVTWLERRVKFPLTSKQKNRFRRELVSTSPHDRTGRWGNLEDPGHCPTAPRFAVALLFPWASSRGAKSRGRGHRWAAELVGCPLVWKHTEQCQTKAVLVCRPSSHPPGLDVEVSVYCSLTYFPFLLKITQKSELNCT